MEESKKLRRSLIIAALALLVALFSISAATFAWYIFNTSARTTEVKMSAGSSLSLEISNAEDGDYGSATQMEEFSGRLIPVSTDSIQGGFQRVDAFHAIWEDGQFRTTAKSFRPSYDVEYYKTSLYLRTNTQNLGIYLADIGFEDADSENPPSTAMMLGLVVEGREYIYEVNPGENEGRLTADVPQDNGTDHPEGGYVMKAGSLGVMTPFSPLTADNLCECNSETDSVALKENSTLIGVISGNGKSGYGEPLKVDVYLWLEGCDRDCTLNLESQTMELLALKFAGFPIKESDIPWIEEDSGLPSS